MGFVKKTVKRLMDIDQLPNEGKSHIFYMIDNLIKAATLKSYLVFACIMLARAAGIAPAVGQ